MIFLGLASNYSAKDILRHSFCVGTKRDYSALEQALASRYGSTITKTSLIYSGRSAITLALESFKSAGFLKPGDLVGVNAFTCYAVVQAVKSAGLTPYFLDLDSPTNNPAQILPNFSLSALHSALKTQKNLKAVIVQNSFGLPLDDQKLLALKKQYHFLLLEDLAHSAGRFYPSGAEIGTIGDATILSFSKGKAIDTITGGACILRSKELSFPASFNKTHLIKRAKNGDTPRASWYPLLGAITRGLSYLHLEKIFLALLLKLHFIERSADTALSFTRTITNWQAKLALRQLNHLPTTPKKTPNLLRDFFLVSDREACLLDLKKHGFRLEESWYECPVSPQRYYKKVNFPETTCKNAVFFSEHVINLPTWYNKSKTKRKEVANAKRIIKQYELK